MKRIVAACAVGALALAAAGGARAAVTDRSAAGFEVTETATIAAAPDKVWQTLMRPARWWDSQHTWSGDAKNLSFDGSGCFCELLPHGAVRHMTIAYADGKSQLRLFGALGPLQSTGATGHLGVTLKPAWSGPVDQVLGAQLARLKKAVETGKPD
jgi:hypothetical protein